jgi:anti-sigma factor ChrR (cupin superfamily)
MKAVQPGERIIANIHETVYEPFINDSGETDGSVLQLNREHKPGVGFHVYRMEPGTTTIPHEHKGHEEFLLLSGDLTDNDGTEYRVGDLVLMRNGTQHCSTTKNGCLLAVYIEVSEIEI